jgi:hypothetical protein
VGTPEPRFAEEYVPTKIDEITLYVAKMFTRKPGGPVKMSLRKIPPGKFELYLDTDD